MSSPYVVWEVWLNFKAIAMIIVRDESATYSNSAFCNMHVATRAKAASHLNFSKAASHLKFTNHV